MKLSNKVVRNLNRKKTFFALSQFAITVMSDD